MNREFREALGKLVSEVSDLDKDLALYDQKTEAYAAVDSLSVSLARSCLMNHAVFSSLKDACQNGDTDEILSLCSELKKSLCAEHGIREYPAIWAVNCWLYAFNAGVYYADDEYLNKVRQLAYNELEQLIKLGDAYAVIVQSESQDDKSDAISRLVSLDHPASLHLEARQITSGEPDADGNKKALDLLSRAYDMGYKAVCLDLALLYTGEACGIDKDPEKVYFYAKEGADKGDSRCMGIVAVALESGDGVEKDEAKALEYYKASAELGNANAQALLGFAYSDGSMGCEIDPQKAFSWFKKSVDGGDYDMADRVGRALLNGDGTEKNTNEALRYFQLGAENGNTVAMIALAEMYSTGEYMKEDYPKSAEWLKKAADAGDPFACHLLADYYREGIGVSKNLARADQYARKAVELGYKDEEVEPDPEPKVDWNDPSVQQAARDFAAEALELEYGIPRDSQQNIDYLDDDTLDFRKVGKGDGITEIRNPKTRGVMAALFDTWNQVVILAQNRGLDVYQDQARAYMFILSSITEDYCEDNVPNMSYFLTNLYLGSKCREKMPKMGDYLKQEYPYYMNLFHELYEQKQNVTAALFALFYRVNRSTGKYPDAIAKDLSVDQVDVIFEHLFKKIQTIFPN